MNFLRFFKKEKAAPEPTGSTAVLSRPIVEKPASERFGKTVMPNAARVLEPAASPSSSGGSKPFSLGDNFTPKPRPQVAPATERTIALQLHDVLPQIPADLLQAVEVDPEQRLVLKAADLERGMANGRPVVLLRSIYQQAPELFAQEIAENDAREIALPFHKVLEQFANFQVRVDQEPDDAVPEVETPFLKVTLEDGQKFGTPARAARPAAPPAVERKIEVPIDVPAPTTASPSAPRAPIRLSLPTEATPAVPKISPNGAGVPITESVPASSGSPAPITLPSPFAPATAPAAKSTPALAPAPAAVAPAPVRIPFKVTPPASDLCPPPELPPLRAATAEARPLSFSPDGPRVKISLRSVLREIPPFQLNGPIDRVPEDAVIELPFAIVQPQLSLGRVAISPAQFHAAMPAEYRPLYKLDAGGVPVSLPLPEILRHLPDASLQLRLDQEEVEVADVFETPFSQKAVEDAARMKTPAGPIARGAPILVPPPAAAEANEPVALTTPAIAAPTAGRTPLQVALDTDDSLDAKSAVAHASRLPGVKACAVVFSDGLSLAGNIPDVYETDALCALAPEIMKRMTAQMEGVNLGELQSVTIHCQKAPVSFFAQQNICLAVLQATSSLADEVRARLARTTQELAQMYAEPSVPNA
ncbi:MAG: hypothetical protein ACR2NX_10870 [Chthoniobacterales bacterium]